MKADKIFDEYEAFGNKYRVKRVIYSVEVNLGETPAERKWRTFLKQAGDAASRGLSARHVAGGSHFAGDVSRKDLAEEERRKRWGESSWLEERELEERKLWVQAYVWQTGFSGPDDLYADAVKYLAELERQKPRSFRPQFAPN
jgi:hypothetical protein